jgi:hypothetical protein
MIGEDLAIPFVWMHACLRWYGFPSIDLRYRDVRETGRQPYLCKDRQSVLYEGLDRRLQ